MTANDGQLALTQYKHEKPDLRAKAVDDLRSILLNPQRIARILGNLTGLAIARQLVEAHGGRIWATSEPGHGTTVAFTLLVGERA